MVFRAITIYGTPWLWEICVLLSHGMLALLDNPILLWLRYFILIKTWLSQLETELVLCSFNFGVVNLGCWVCLGIPITSSPLCLEIPCKTSIISQGVVKWLKLYQLRQLQPRSMMTVVESLSTFQGAHDKAWRPGQLLETESAEAASWYSFYRLFLFCIVDVSFQHVLLISFNEIHLV